MTTLDGMLALKARAWNIKLYGLINKISSWLNIQKILLIKCLDKNLIIHRRPYTKDRSRNRNNSTISLESRNTIKRSLCKRPKLKSSLKILMRVMLS